MRKEAEEVEDELTKQKIYSFITNAVTAVDINPAREERVRTFLNQLRLAIRLALVKGDNKRLEETVNYTREEIINLIYNLTITP